MQTFSELRRSRNLTVLDLARLTGLPARLIAEAEYGLRQLTPHEQYQLAFVFGVPEGYSSATTLAAARPLPTLVQPVAYALVTAALAGAITATLLREFELPRFSLSALAPGARPPAIERTIEPDHLPLPRLSSLPAQPELLLVGAARAPAARPTTPEAPTPALHSRPFHELVSIPSAFVLTEEGPVGCPVLPLRGRVVMTQGYGVGSHAPAEVWGAVDLAVDANGDGWAEQEATLHTPVVTTIGGIVQVNHDSWPGGNHIWVEDPATGWRTGYAHLGEIFVTSGQAVKPGNIIGTIGTSGLTSGPHLDYQVWRWQTNLDPTRLVGVCS